MKNLGSAKSGVAPWIALRALALALIPSTIYMIVGFLSNVVGKDRETALLWLQSPISAAFCLITIVAGTRHFALGMQVVVEDYVHDENIRIPLMIAIRFFCLLMAAIGVLSLFKIFAGA